MCRFPYIIKLCTLYSNTLTKPNEPQSSGVDMGTTKSGHKGQRKGRGMCVVEKQAEG